MSGDGAAVGVAAPSRNLSANAGAGRPKIRRPKPSRVKLGKGMLRKIK